MWRYLKIIYNYSYLFINLFTIYSKSIDIKNNEIWIDALIKNITISGPICIKFVQWLLPITKSVYPDLLITHKFSIFFDDCNIHDINHTKKIYKKYFKSELLDNYKIIDLIGSGSIGQVYIIENKKKEKFALKVSHPDINFQIYIFIYIFKLIKKIIDFKSILPIVDIDEFLYSLKDQTNLEIEARNNDLFCKLYSDTENIIIPKIRKNFPEIFIMDYRPGVKLDINKISISKYSRVLTLLAIFIENSCLNEISHGDLHEGNWAIDDLDTDNPKIIIYDYGFCFNVNENEYQNGANLLIQSNKIIELKQFLKFYLNKKYNNHIDSEKILNTYRDDPLFDTPYMKEKNVSLLKFIPALIKYLIKNKINITYTCMNSFVLFLQLCSYFGGSRMIGGTGNETGLLDYYDYTNNIISVTNKFNICRRLRIEKEKEILKLDGKFSNNFDKFKNLKKFI